LGVESRGRWGLWAPATSREMVRGRGEVAKNGPQTGTMGQGCNQTMGVKKLRCGCLKIAGERGGDRGGRHWPQKFLVKRAGEDKGKGWGVDEGKTKWVQPSDKGDQEGEGSGDQKDTITRSQPQCPNWGGGGKGGGKLAFRHTKGELKLLDFAYEERIGRYKGGVDENVTGKELGTLSDRTKREEVEKRIIANRQGMINSGMLVNGQEKTGGKKGRKERAQIK